MDKQYNCKKITLYPPKNFIPFNSSEGYKDSITIVVECLADEIQTLWSQGIHTRGCCCGHGRYLGFIQVSDEDISQMEALGYCHYIYEDNFGGVERKDAFIPKTYGHVYDGYSEGFTG